MSALHYGRAEAAANTTGRLVYTTVAAEQPLPGWPATPTTATVTRLIPAQRRPVDTAPNPSTAGAR